MTALNIQTAHNVGIEWHIASLGDRYVASLIDYGLCFAYLIGTSLVLSNLGMLEGYLSILILALPYAFYDLVCEILFNGQSLGKNLCGLKVVKLDGSKVTLSDYLLRWLFRIVDTFITFGGAATFTVIMNGKGQRLGDVAAGTTLVDIRKQTQKSLSANVFDHLPDETHEVNYPQVATSLSDQDIATIQSVLRNAKKIENYDIIQELATKVRSLLQIEQDDTPPTQFIRMVIQDYNFLNS
ncbi:MAG: RDD family protein [Chitinophagales bacterium]